MPCLDGQDYLILNSTSKVNKAIDALSGYEHIHCMLDNDDAGWKATNAIRNEYSYRVRDSSFLYKGYNDLNEYLCGERQKKQDARQHNMRRKIEHLVVLSGRKAWEFRQVKLNGVPIASGVILGSKVMFR